MTGDTESLEMRFISMSMTEGSTLGGRQIVAMAA